MILFNYSYRVLYISTCIHGMMGIISIMPAPGLILLLSSSSTRNQTFGKVYKNIFPLHNLFLLDSKYKLYLSGVTQSSLFYCSIPPLDPDDSVDSISNTTRIPRRHHVLPDIAMEQTYRSQCLPGDTAMQIFFSNLSSIAHGEDWSH